MAKSETKWKIRFYLETRATKSEPDPKIEKHINMFVTFGIGKRLQFYTRESAKKDDIVNNYLKRVDEDVYFFRPIKPSINNSMDINNRLEGLARETVRLIKAADNSEPRIEVTVDYLRENLRYYLDGTNKIEEKKSISLSEALDKYINYSEQQKAANSARNDRQFRAKLDAFTSRRKYSGMMLSKIDQTFADDFHSHLMTLNLVNNSVVKHLRCFKTFHHWCQSKGWPIPDVKIQVKENIPEIIYLTEEELKLIEDKEITSQKLDRVRDILVFSCYTGMRISDIRKLKKKDYDGEQVRYFETKLHKTISHTVPIVEGAERVVIKYWELPDEILLPQLSEQKYSEYLKELLKLLEINRLVTLAEQRGGKIEEKTYPLHELISSHIGRKTFITRMIKREMPEPFIKSITGHSKNSRSFSRYYEIDDTSKREKLKKYLSNSHQDEKKITDNTPMSETQQP
jgi:integrase